MSGIVEKSSSVGILSRWILNARLDVVLFVGTPLLIIPLFYAASHRWSNEDLFLIVSTFGALGHHAPGLMRAYGDKQLFHRFWLRFTVVPIVCMAVFSVYPLSDLPGVMLVLVAWGLWHFLMQTYGFARIYDAKVKSFDAITRHLDFAVCVAWTGSCILSAPERVNEFLELALKSGLNFVLYVPLDALRVIWLSATVLVTILFFANLFRKVHRRESFNVAKVILFVTTFAFFWLCSVTLTNFLLGIAMFELFHDVQYLGIVWLFNRNRVDKEPDVGPFTRFLFQPGTGLLGAYVGMVLAYGFLGFAAERLTSDRLQHILFGIVATSNLLHFYYDGFIWKIREPDTGTALGVSMEGSSRRMTGGIVHASKWLLLLAVVGSFLVAERSSKLTELEQAEAILKQQPKSVRAHETLAKVLFDQKRYIDVIRVCREAEQIGEPQYRTYMYLGVALTASGQPGSGFAALDRAFQRNPRDPFLRFHLAMGLIQRQQFAEALTHLQAAVGIEPENPTAQYNLGALQLYLGHPEDAIESLTRTVEIDNGNVAAWQSLGEACLKLGKADLATTHLTNSLAANPDNAKTHELLATALRAAGRHEAANDSLRNALKLLIRHEGSEGEKIRAIAIAEDLLNQTKRTDPTAFTLAARVYAANERLDDAVQTASAGAKLAREQGADTMAARLDLLAEQYSAELNESP